MDLQSLCLPAVDKILYIASLWKRESSGQYHELQISQECKTRCSISSGYGGGEKTQCATFCCVAGTAVTAHRGGLNSRDPRPSADNNR